MVLQLFLNSLLFSPFLLSLGSYCWVNWPLGSTLISFIDLCILQLAEAHGALLLLFFRLCQYSVLLGCKLLDGKLFSHTFGYHSINFSDYLSWQLELLLSALLLCHAPLPRPHLPLVLWLLSHIRLGWWDLPAQTDLILAFQIFSHHSFYGYLLIQCFDELHVNDLLVMIDRVARPDLLVPLRAVHFHGSSVLFFRPHRIFQLDRAVRHQRLNVKNGWFWLAILPISIIWGQSILKMWFPCRLSLDLSSASSISTLCIWNLFT